MYCCLLNFNLSQHLKWERDQKIAPRKITSNKYPPELGLGFGLKQGAIFQRGAIFQGAISVYQMRILVFSMKAVKVGYPQSGLCVKSHSVSALTDLN